MTEKQAKEKLIEWCKKQVGYHEGDNNWNKYAGNADLITWYGWRPQNQPWCDIFVDSAFLNCFGLDRAAMMTFQPIGQGTALCSASANYYKANSAWFDKPEVGDQVFFNHSGGINHTGIVIAVSGGVVTTIEGNSSDSVRQNAYSIGASYIAGYGRPKWSIVTDEKEKQEEKADNTPSNGELIIDDPPPEHDIPAPADGFCIVAVKLPVVKYGDATVYVRIMQTLLISKGFSCGWMGADGEFGDKTKEGLKKYQKQMKFKEEMLDGVCGEKTWAALLGVK